MVYALIVINIPQTYNDYMIFNPTQTMQNPSANGSDPNVATLTFVIDEPFDIMMWKVSEEFREKSVLTGLSAVGGLGSLLSTLFIILLGTSLMKATMRRFISLPRCSTLGAQLILPNLIHRNERFQPPRPTSHRDER